MCSRGLIMILSLSTSSYSCFKPFSHIAESSSRLRQYFCEAADYSRLPTLTKEPLLTKNTYSSIPARHIPRKIPSPFFWQTFCRQLMQYSRAAEFVLTNEQNGLLWTLCSGSPAIRFPCSGWRPTDHKTALYPQCVSADGFSPNRCG